MNTSMNLPVMPPVSPMLAKSIPGMPAPESVDGGLLYNRNGTRPSGSSDGGRPE